MGKARTRSRTAVDILQLQIQEAFWSRVDRNGPLPAGAPWLGPCWLWSGPVTAGGYGTFSYAGRRWPAHHFAFLTRTDTSLRPARLDQLCHSWSTRTCRGGPDCLHRRCVLHTEDVTTVEYAHRNALFNPYAQQSVPRPRRPTCDAGHLWLESQPEFDDVGRRLCPTCLTGTSAAAGF